MADRRTSLERNETNPSDVFDDEFEVEDWDMGVTDGFRPTQHSDPQTGDRRHDEQEDENAAYSHNHRESLRITSMSAHFADDNITARRSTTRNSIRKDQTAVNPFASLDDEHDDFNASTLSFEPDHDRMLHRSISSASTQQFASTSSPRFGSGPSHPYSMYPQGTAARTASVATASTIRPSLRQSMPTQAGPQHPYTMYPQGVEEDLDEGDDHNAASSIVPMGFPGLGRSYHRQVGPDGEEQDMIGEFGHTEQLPPYSRYPEDGPEKMPLLAPEAPRALHSRAPVEGTDPTMPLMHTVLAPQEPREPQSMTDDSNLARSMSRSTRSSALLLPTHSSSSSSSLSSSTKKTWKEKNWSERRRTRFCGIPFWLLMVALLLVVFVTSVLGGVVGGFMQGSRKHKPPPNPASSTSLYDASIIPSPTNMVPPTGTWQLQLSTPTEVKNGCLVQASQAAAWSCSLGGPPAAALGVAPLPGTNRTGAYLYYASDNQYVYYGAQASFMQTNPAPIITVLDTDSPGEGPAFYFQHFYDKLVVLQEDALKPTSGGAKIKRDSILNAAWFEERQLAKSGDKPWFCIWNQTFIEGYIYMQQTVAASYGLTAVASASSSPATATAASSTTAGPGPSMQTASQNMISTTVSLPSTTTTYMGPASQFPSWSASVYQAQKFGKIKTLLDEWLTHDKRDPEWNALPAFPYLVKIEERRLPNNPSRPYCQQYQILDNLQYNIATDSKGQPIWFPLVEQDPNYSASQSKNGVLGSRRLKRDDSAQSCHCQWMSGQ